MSLLKKANDDFKSFLNIVFSQSKDILKDGRWTGGNHPDTIADFLDHNSQTIRVSARDHLKSMSFYAHIMFKIFRMYWDGQSREVQYFSYGERMASYHCQKIKTAIKSNPFFREVIDNKPQAESILSFSWFEGGPKLTVTPRGLLEFKRGIHCDDVYVDDPFQDPESKLVPTKIKRINEVMKTQILDMFQKELHVVGTAQTTNDFFFDKEFTKRFKVLIQPAIVELAEKKVLWPEWMDFEELMHKKAERGEKVFNQEYMCSPVYSEEQYISNDAYDLCINPKLVNFKLEDYEVQDDVDVVGGFDIGKKQHPSHFSVFRKDPDDRKWKQVHSKWFDKWDYKDQVEYLARAIDAFGIYLLPYDNTRGEFEGFDEQGLLPAEMEAVNFSHRSKHSMAANFDKCLTNKRVELLPERRQRDQVLIVNNDLVAPETKDGHADAFWSICLALKEIEGGAVGATVI